MRYDRRVFGNSYPAHFSKFAVVILLVAGFLPSRSFAQQQGQKTFSSAEDAIGALVTATEKNDEKMMVDILGPDARQIVYSGDDTEDAEGRANFVQKFQEMHRLVTEPDGTTTLYIGAENWPTPIPLLNKDGAWYFNTDMARKEILYRRVGENELWTIRICEELAAAQKEYRQAHQGEYAQKIFSDEGRHNGLYWKADPGETQSPIGPLVASAVAEGYAPNAGGPPAPYHGYYFHILTSQGEHAPGGAKNYIVSGKMKQGFAFVAYPAEYRSSGVMTFVVTDTGVVYQKDLGKMTPATAKAMKEYNPVSGWKRAEEESMVSAGDGTSK